MTEAPHVELESVETDDPRFVNMHQTYRSESLGEYDPLASEALAVWLVKITTGSVGFVLMNAFDPIARRVRGATFILPQFRRKGIAKEAVRQRNELFYKQYNARKIEASVNVENTASVRLVESLGALQEGILREVAYYDGRYHDFFVYAWFRDRPDLGRQV